MCALTVFFSFFSEYNQPMDEETRRKLRGLGVVKGTRHLKPAPPVARKRGAVSGERPAGQPPAPNPQPLEKLLPGLERMTTAVGDCFVLDKVYPLTHQHGADGLADLLAFAPGELAAYVDDGRFADLDFRDFVFLDTETTGLAGAGTLAFMVGAGFFEGDAFITRQYFLRDHGDEPAMLTLLDELLAEKAGIVSFNGRSFDLPLLDGRYLMNRMLGRVLDLPHLDLLHPARRLWRARLGSCALGSLEQSLLDLHRTHADVPGYAIPGMYHDYLRTGDGRDMARVFYHNEIDLLSMVTLAARLVALLVEPGAAHPLDVYCLGKWQAALGMNEQAEQNLRAAAQGELPLDWYHKALFELGWLLKRNGRRAEAVPFWQQIAATTFEDVTAHIELAKFYEWHQVDLEKAVRWTEQALKLVGDSLIQDELQHRLARLERKRSR
ncbi:MAG: ribonuclease H-like domain-containing protein [Anaerolineae bacterium]